MVRCVSRRFAFRGCGPGPISGTYICGDVVGNARAVILLQLYCLCYLKRLLGIPCVLQAGRSPCVLKCDSYPLRPFIPFLLSFFFFLMHRTKWEEVDVLVSGGNYGWSDCEGTITYPTRNNDVTLCDGSNTSSPFETPKLTYGHSVGNSVIGCCVYRANRNTCIQVSHSNKHAKWPVTTATLWHLQGRKLGGRG